MDELKQIDRLVKPDEVFLVCDAMTGQDAVNSAKAFNDALELNGVILTKLDGDARGGAALSIKEVTKVPIKFIGVGEKLDTPGGVRPRAHGPAHHRPGRHHGRSSKRSQRVQPELSQEEIEKQQEKLQKGDFTLDDFRKQFEQMAKMGGMKDMIGAMPGMGEMIPEGEDPEAALKRIQGMIDSMTKEERRDPDIIDLSRRRRIAAGSGTEPHEIKQFLEQFDQVRTLMRQMANMSMWRAHQDDDRPGQGRHVSARRHDAEDEGRHRPPQERQGTGRGTQEETQETLKLDRSITGKTLWIICRDSEVIK